uniref:Major facilitator superfamily associated domain-containing protein n=1 Tax=Globisporangium ultimum (strain ATCC 200006 / CBS 805.95 / DAOM BR144) TaxID=431595 RepID=K3WDE3_GLOUD
MDILRSDTVGTSVRSPRDTLQSFDLHFSFDVVEYTEYDAAATLRQHRIDYIGTTTSRAPCDNPAMLDFHLTPIAGNDVFTRQTYGALRKGGRVSLFSKAYIGYAISAACSGYMFAMVESVLLRLPAQTLGLDDDGTMNGLRDVVHLQWSLVPFLGLLSDSYAPFGYRRKAYIIMGWILMSLFFAALFVLCQFSSYIFGSAVPPQAVALACTTGATVSLVISTNTMDIRIVELSQQEQVYSRGTLVAVYQILRIFAQVIVHILIQRLSILFALHLSIFALVPIPFLVRYAYETRLNKLTAAPSQFIETCKQFWQSGQQKAIWQLVAFNCVLYFFLFLNYNQVSRAIAVWNPESASAKLLRLMLSDVAFVAALVLWKVYAVNAHWVKSAAAVICSWCVVYLTGNTLIAFDVVRQQWLTTLLGMLCAGVRVLLLFSAFVPTIEVAQIGSEGTIYGLLSSFQSIVKSLGAQLSNAIVKSSPGVLMFPLSEIRANSSSIQVKVFYGILFLAAIKLLSLLSLLFCPRHKLDAQQLRLYGGYRRLPLLVFLLAYAMSYPYVTYYQYAHMCR